MSTKTLFTSVALSLQTQAMIYGLSHFKEILLMSKRENTEYFCEKLAYDCPYSADIVNMLRARGAAKKTNGFDRYRAYPSLQRFA